MGGGVGSKGTRENSGGEGGDGTVLYLYGGDCYLAVCICQNLEKCILKKGKWHCM